jgi:hypothetical protein
LIDDEIALLRESLANQAIGLKTANKSAADWKKVEGFLKGDIRWLDELEVLATRSKGADRAYFGATTFLLEPRNNTALISAKYYATLQDVIPEVQAAYRDSKHTVRGTSVTQHSDKKYPWASDLTITLAPAEVEDPRNRKTTPPPAEPAAPATTLPDPAAAPIIPPEPAAPAIIPPEAAAPATTLTEPSNSGDAT